MDTTNNIRRNFAPKKKNLINLLTSIGGRLLILALSLLLPRFILKSYGSEVNGLFSSINNFYSYLALLETGIGASSLQLLYKPVVENDRKTINCIIYSTKHQFRKIGIFYGISSFLLSIILPFVVKTDLAWFPIFAIAILQGLSSVINFMVLGGVTNILAAEGKNYIKDLVVVSTNVLTSIAKIILVNQQVNIILLQCSYFILSMLPVLVYTIYFKKCYPWLKKNDNTTLVKLPQSKYFFLHNLSGAIFNHTDTILISIFLGLDIASIYSIYYLIFNSVYALINSVFSNISYTLGQQYNLHKNNLDEYIKFHDGYKASFCLLTFAIFTVTCILTIPFVKIYTRGIDDVEYIYIYMPILFTLINLLSSCRSTETKLIELSFRAKQTLWRSLLESAINLIVSIILIQFIGIYGCLIGTIIALLYRTNDIIFYANKKILNRTPLKAYSIILVDSIIFASCFILFKFINLEISSYGEFVMWGFILTIAVFSIYLLINIICFRKEIVYFVRLVFAKKQNV